jgi:hypothetical protein
MPARKRRTVPAPRTTPALPRSREICTLRVPSLRQAASRAIRPGVDFLGGVAGPRQQFWPIVFVPKAGVERQTLSATAAPPSP